MIEVVPDPRPDRALVEAFEQSLPAPLPQDYRRFLLQTGGTETVEDYAVRNGVISEFLTLGDQEYDLFSVRSETSGFGKCVPFEYLIIAPGAGGDLCLLLEGLDSGSVWWADYDLAHDILTAPVGSDELRPLREIMQRLSSTFSDFLSSFPTSGGDG